MLRIELAIATPNSGVAIDTQYGVCLKFRGKLHYFLWQHADGHAAEKLADDVSQLLRLWVCNRPIVD